MKTFHIRHVALGICATTLLCSPVIAQSQVKVGVMQGLSGPPAIVDFGESYLQGIRLALKDHEASDPKIKIELVVYDDEANPQRAVSLAQRLIQSDRVSAVIGTVSSGNVLAMAPSFQKAGIPLVAGPAAVTAIAQQFIGEKPSYIFRCSMVTRFETNVITDWAVQSNKKIGLLHSTTGAGLTALKEIEELLGAKGKKLTLVEAAAPGVNDLTPQLIKMRDAGVEILMNFHESYELAFRPLARINYKPSIVGPWGLSSMKVPQIVGKQALEGTMMSQAFDASTEAGKIFDQRMRKEYGSAYRWPVVASLGYDAGQIVFKAVERVGKPNAVDIRNAIENTTDLKAVSATPAKPFSATDHECLDPKDIFLGHWTDGTVSRMN
nr:branched-chain amino acid ABC transporter, amino acid-binding protein [uncultured bacterium]